MPYDMPIRVDPDFYERERPRQYEQPGRPDIMTLQLKSAPPLDQLNKRRKEPNQITGAAKKIRECLKKYPGLKCCEIRKKTGICASTVSKTLRDLTEKGVIRKEGQYKQEAHYLTGQEYKPPKKDGRIDVILRIMEKFGRPMDTPEIAYEARATVGSICSLLRYWEQRGVVRQTGKAGGKNGAYFWEPVE